MDRNLNGAFTSFLPWFEGATWWWVLLRVAGLCRVTLRYSTVLRSSEDEKSSWLGSLWERLEEWLADWREPRRGSGANLWKQQQGCHGPIQLKFPDISLTIPWPWKKIFFPDFSLMRGNPEQGIMWIPYCQYWKCSSINWTKFQYMHRADSRFAHSQWEMLLLCNDVSHWLGANPALKASLTSV